MPTFLMIAVVILNVTIFVFGIGAGLEMYVADRRYSREYRRKVGSLSQPRTIIEQHDATAAHSRSQTPS